MSCKERIRILTSKCIDDEATPDERGEVEAHLRGCAECRAFRDALRFNERLVAEALLDSRPDETPKMSRSFESFQRETDPAAVPRPVSDVLLM